jgi:hypothetical protein
MFGRKHGQGSCGPWRGEYFERAGRPISYGPVVAWHGKVLVTRPTVGNEHRRYEFADGSWADPLTGECRNGPGPGKVIVVTGDQANEAARALLGVRRRRQTCTGARKFPGFAD